MPGFLAIESSAAWCSVALDFNGKTIVREQHGERSHTRSMLPFIDEILCEQQCRLTDLDAIVFSAGPGSFTGIRLASSVAKSLAYAAGIPVVPVSSLACIAQAVARVSGSFEPCLVICDARMGDVYLAEYAFDSAGLAFPLHADSLKPLAGLQLDVFSARRLAGNAASLLADCPGIEALEILDEPGHARDLLLPAVHAFSVGKAETPLTAQSVYLRDKTSWKNTQQQLEEKRHHTKG